VKQKNDQRPIVCGTDFSATATEAVDIAAAMARRLKTKLVLVHVDQLLGALVSNPIVLESAVLQRRGDLDDEAQRLRDLGTEIEEKFLSGSAFDELVTAANKSKARLVVVGAVGHGFARRLPLGSVAERTAETSTRRMDRDSSRHTEGDIFASDRLQSPNRFSRARSCHCLDPGRKVVSRLEN